jgi:hypothetical protein
MIRDAMILVTLLMGAPAASAAPSTPAAPRARPAAPAPPASHPRAVWVQDSSAGAETDTTVAVRPGMRLVVDNYAGDVAVKSWLKDAVHLEAQHSRRVRVEVETSPAALAISVRGDQGPGRADLRLTVPAWLPLQIDGVHTDITIEGSKGELRAQTVGGDIEVTGGNHFVSLSSVEGAVRLVGARGRVQVSSVNEGVELKDVVGQVSAESVDGDVVLRRVNSSSVEGTTINGSLVFDGLTKSGGLYTLSTHNGSILVGLPEKPDVSVSVSTFDGDVSTAFPVKISEGRRGKPISFVLGAGGANLELESFQGNVRILRVGDTFERAWERLRATGEGYERAAARAAQRSAMRSKMYMKRVHRLDSLKMKRLAPDKDDDPDDEDPDQK